MDSSSLKRSSSSPDSNHILDSCKKIKYNTFNIHECRFLSTEKKHVEELSCPICLHVAFNSVMLPCQHIICQTCINNIPCDESGKITCVLCRYKWYLLFFKLPCFLPTLGEF